MKQSIKLDIIYFGVERDTKMEFCFNDYDKLPIRTLASAVNGQEEFLYALKRAVYRSNTVIVVGGLEGGVYIPAVIGAAIGVAGEKVDYPAMGFAEPEKPLIFPKGSIPLVTPDNRIGGMLLEKGRQAIIVLSEDADVRHQLLDNLIYPYIFDLSAEETEAEEAPISAEEAPEEQISEPQAAEEIEDIAEAAEEPAEIAEEPAEIIEAAEPESAEETPLEEVAVNPLPIVSDGMFVIADDGSGEEDPEDEIPEEASEPIAAEDIYDSSIFAGFTPEEEDDESEYYDDGYYAPRVSAGKVLGVIFALLCIGAAAAIFTMFFMGLI